MSALQGFDGADLRTSLTQDALSGILAMAGVVTDFHIHRACFKALSTFDALALVAVDAYPGEVAHGFEEYRNRTDILTESPIILEE